MPDDTQLLHDAVKSAAEAWPELIAVAVINQLDNQNWPMSLRLELARAVLAMPVPAPAVDREGLIRLIADASNHNPFPEAEDIADTLIEAGTVRGPEAATVVTEHAIGMTDGSMQVRSPHPEIERVFPLAEWIPAHQRFGGKVWRRRIRVVEDWVEEPKGAGGDHA